MFWLKNRLHIHWFRKTKWTNTDEIFRFKYKQCRCGTIKIVDFKKIYINSLERLWGIPKEKLQGLEVGLRSCEVIK